MREPPLPPPDGARLPSLEELAAGVNVYEWETQYTLELQYLRIHGGLRPYLLIHPFVDLGLRCG